MNNDPQVLVKLLRAIAEGETAKETKHDVIFSAAADLITEIARIILDAFVNSETFLGSTQTLMRRIVELEKGFKPCVLFQESPDMTEIVLADKAIVWSVWDREHTPVEVGYDFEGNLIGMRVYGDARRRVDAPT